MELVFDGTVHDVVVDSSTKIGEGDTVEVYSYGENVIKLMKPEVEIGSDVFDEDTCSFISDYHEETKLIKLPKEPVYDVDRNYLGFIQEKNYSGKTSLFLEPCEILLNNLSLLKEDVQKISSLGIVGGDWTADNLMYDDQTKRMALTDPGIYTVEFGDSESEILKQNQYYLNEFISDLIEEQILSLGCSHQEAGDAIRSLRKASEKYQGFLGLMNHDLDPAQMESFATLDEYCRAYQYHRQMFNKSR